MMFDKLREKLQALGCRDWELTQTDKTSWEFYFIRHRLDQHRVVDVTSFEVTVYRQIEEGFVGNASGEVFVNSTDEQIDEFLNSLMAQAVLVKNPVYEIADKPVEEQAQQDVDVRAIAGDFIRAMRDVPETETEYLNSYEIFASRITRRYLNSKGVAYTCTYPSSMAAVVVTARRGDHEIELYRIYRSGTCDAKRLTSDVAGVMAYGADRLSAVPTPSLGTADVVFSTSDAVNIYSFFTNRMTAGAKIRKISPWEIGKPVFEEATGDAVTVRAVPVLENSSRNDTVDEEGCAIREKLIIENGVARNFWGGRQFSQYLGLEDSALINNFIITGGTKSAEEIRSGDYLEVVEFSDFQVDAMGGDIAGEIRLGYLHQGGKVTVVTGGSVSGTMLKAGSSMEFSAETVQYDTKKIPAVTKLHSLSVTGAEG